jgi:hypothetical protein
VPRFRTESIGDLLESKLHAGRRCDDRRIIPSGCGEKGQQSSGKQRSWHQASTARGGSEVRTELIHCFCNKTPNFTISAVR